MPIFWTKTKNIWYFYSEEYIWIVKTTQRPQYHLHHHFSTKVQAQQLSAKVKNVTQIIDAKSWMGTELFNLGPSCEKPNLSKLNLLKYYGITYLAAMDT